MWKPRRTRKRSSIDKPYFIKRPTTHIFEISALELHCNILEGGEEMFLLSPQDPDYDDALHINKTNSEDYENF